MLKALRKRADLRGGIGRRGLALAFLIIALRPDLIRGPSRSPGPAPPAADRAPPAPLRVTYAAAVERAARP